LGEGDTPNFWRSEDGFSKKKKNCAARLATLIRRQCSGGMLDMKTTKDSREKNHGLCGTSSSDKNDSGKYQFTKAAAVRESHNEGSHARGGEGINEEEGKEELFVKVLFRAVQSCRLQESFIHLRIPALRQGSSSGRKEIGEVRE